MTNKPLIVFAIAAAIIAMSGSAMAADAAAGEEVFKKKCSSCHALDKAKTGPALGGIVGRKAGSTDFGKYKGLVDADFEWTPELLDEYIEDPKAFVKAHTSNERTSMTFKLKDEQERADVIEYLKTTN
jgi:cytochrome c